MRPEERIPFKRPDKWARRFKALGILLGQIVALVAVAGIGYGFWLDFNKKDPFWVKEPTRSAEPAKWGAGVGEEKGVVPFGPEVIDQEIALEYAESQRMELEVLGEALAAYRSVHDENPAGANWQGVLIEARTLSEPVYLDPLPIDITWVRKPPPPLELFPGEDEKGKPTIILAAGGVVLATYRSGEIFAEEQPIPPDAALPPIELPPDSSAQQTQKAPSLPAVLPAQSSR